MDIWPLYLFHDRAQTINAAISVRAHCTIRSRADHRLTLVSDDTHERVEAASPDELDFARLPLVARLVRHFGVTGVDIITRSESPVGAGIAGSSAMNVAICSALAAWTNAPIHGEDLLSLAMNIEAQVLNVPAGVQDYRPALYGGVSAVELGVTGVKRVALRVDSAALTARLVVAYTGASRNSGINNWDVMKHRIDGDPAVSGAFDAIRDASAGVRHGLESGDWTAVCRHLTAEWNARKRLAPGVTTARIEDLLSRALAAGAGAGKVCGAGGGGCLFVLVDPDRKREVADALSRGGADVLPVSVDPDGVRLSRS